MLQSAFYVFYILFITYPMIFQLPHQLKLKLIRITECWHKLEILPNSKAEVAKRLHIWQSSKYSNHKILIMSGCQTAHQNEKPAKSQKVNRRFELIIAAF